MQILPKKSRVNEVIPVTTIGFIRVYQVLFERDTPVDEIRKVTANFWEEKTGVNPVLGVRPEKREDIQPYNLEAYDITVSFVGEDATVASLKIGSDTSLQQEYLVYLREHGLYL